MEHNVLTNLLNVFIHSVTQLGVVSEGVFNMAIEVNKQLSETAPFLLVLVEEFLT
jgi:hypothetical protein